MEIRYSMLMNLDLFEKRVPREAYLQDPFDVAKKVLLGAYLCTRMDGRLTVGQISEVEVYLGAHDKASHTYRYHRSPRVESTYKIGGHTYVFFVYGMHHQLCVVTSEPDEPNAILIRGVKPVYGIDVMQQRRGMQNLKNLTNGPGKLCQAFGITRKLDGKDLLGDEIWITPRVDKIPLRSIHATPRIGIPYAEEFILKPWRFILY